MSSCVSCRGFALVHPSQIKQVINLLEVLEDSFQTADMERRQQISNVVFMLETLRIQEPLVVWNSVSGMD